MRAKLLSFAVIMQEKLDDNAHKGGWANETPKQLLKRAKQELRELEAAVNNTYQSEDDIAREAADVANFCMMIADVCGGLK